MAPNLAPRWAKALDARAEQREPVAGVAWLELDSRRGVVSPTLHRGVVLPVRYRWLMVATPGRSAKAPRSELTIVRSVARAVAAIRRS